MGNVCERLRNGLCHDSEAGLELEVLEEPEGERDESHHARDLEGAPLRASLEDERCCGCMSRAPKGQGPRAGL